MAMPMPALVNGIMQKVIRKPKIKIKQTRDYHDNMIPNPEAGYAPHERL